jgi:hypothetical protein
VAREFFCGFVGGQMTLVIKIKNKKEHKIK